VAPSKAVRGWDFWTEAKLGILSKYLPAFTTAAKRSPGRIYLDAFAGVVENVRRSTGEPIDGSARIAPRVVDPPFDELHYFELTGKAAQLEEMLRDEFPERTISVHGGDCNEQIPRVLRGINRRAATFAFLDPDGMELAWDTISALAEHKRQVSRFKIELWMLFTAAGFARTLPLEKELPTSSAHSASRLFGTDQWQAIHELRRKGAINGRHAREEYVNLMRWRLERVLGYASTHALDLHNAQDRSVYHLVFATDNKAGDQIMRDLYAEQARLFPKMRQQAAERRREQRTGQPRLLELEPVDEPSEKLYRPEPPWPPPSTDERAE
jgi:three-Cys-motif partner protein